jgi:hypothetical protein
VTGLPTSITADAGRYPFSLEIASSCGDWRARSDAVWADVAPGSGRGNATLMLTVEQNVRPDDSRTATVTVNSTPFRVTQNRFVCSYAIDRTALDQDPGGSNVRINLTTQALCPWTATASEPWIRVLTPSGIGSAAVSIDLEFNSRSQPRQGYVTIAGLRVDVLQRRNDL